MLYFLDAQYNVKGAANENFAREVMELFTMGVGNYSETDVREGARAFTGWYFDNLTFKVDPAKHDDGVKTVLGKTGKFRGDDITKILLEQPATAEFLCAKMFRHFVSEVDAPSPALIAPVAEAFRKSNYDVKVPVAMILDSGVPSSHSLTTTFGALATTRGATMSGSSV